MQVEANRQTPMRIQSTLFGAMWVLWLLLATGCEGTLSDPRMDRLAGVWRLDFSINEDLVDNLMEGKQPEDQSLSEKLTRGAVKSFLKEKLPGLNKAITGMASDSMQLSFSADGTWASTTNLPMAKGEKKGMWKVVEASKDSMTIHCQWTDPISKESQTAIVPISFLSPDQIRLVPPNMSGTEMELTFDRQPAK